MDHKEMKRAYKETPAGMGVVLVRNLKTDAFLLKPSRNAEGLLNRLRFSLAQGGPTGLPKGEQMAEDFKRLGADAFELKVLDLLKPKDEPGWDPDQDLAALAALWRAELQAKGWRPC